MAKYKITLKDGRSHIFIGDELTYSEKHVRVDVVQQRLRFGPRSFNNLVHTVIVLDSDTIEKVEVVF